MLPKLFYFDMETLELTAIEKLVQAKLFAFETSNKKKQNLQSKKVKFTKMYLRHSTGKMKVNHQKYLSA